ncbi:MAG TPA: serine/threonine-protein kinase [Anaerolineaceae bacterium]|nr:serine/threonine-protein kinase [Anaerolineaceae bacterium]HPN50157.1 serine/threonine-protein kinase [Anaerolineaceae bacterium]
MSFTVGEMVGPYRILQQLGQGGMATVYKAYHAALDRYVAIKVLHPAFTEDPNFQARFQREARLVARLEHPNIVPIYDFAEHEGRPYLVMKFIEGQTLKAVMEARPLAPRDILRIVEAVGAALSYAHSQGILHRDVKPSNVLMTSGGQIYLADFGLARIAQSGSSTLTSDMLVGTPQYISPEQALSKSDLDERTDIYSFGIMVYEMVVGQVPYNADTPFAVIHDHIYTPLPLPSQVNPQIPPAMERVLLKALAKEKNDRYSDVTAFVTAFSTVMTDELERRESGAPTVSTAPTPPALPVQDATLPPTQAPVRAARKKWATWQKVAAVLGVLLLCSCLCLWGVNAAGKMEEKKAMTETAGAAVEILAAETIPAPENAMPQQKGTEVIQPEMVGTLPVTRSTPTDEERAAAQKLVEEAVALWPDQPLEALARLNQAQKIMGNRSGFYMQAGETLAEQGVWPLAAFMYVNAYRGNPEGMTEEQLIKAREAVFKASKNPQSKTIMPKRLDWPPLDIGDIRYEVYNGNLDTAKTLIGANPDLSTDYPEMLLVEAELFIKLQDSPRAQEIINTLLTRSDLPEWIKAEAGEILNAAKNP